MSSSRRAKGANIRRPGAHALQLLALICSGCARTQPPARPRLPESSLGAKATLDRIVAVVDREVLTYDEMMREARVALALREGADAAEHAQQDELFVSLRDYIIGQTLVALQAQRLGAQEPTPEQTAQRIAELRSRFRDRGAYEAFLERFRITPASVAAIASRDLRNEAYLAARMRTRLLGAAADAAPDPAAYRRAVQAWLLELRETVEIRIEGANGKLERPAKREITSSAGLTP